MMRLGINWVPWGVDDVSAGRREHPTNTRAPLDTTRVPERSGASGPRVAERGRALEALWSPFWKFLHS